MTASDHKFIQIAQKSLLQGSQLLSALAAAGGVYGKGGQGPTTRGVIASIVVGGTTSVISGGKEQ